MVTALTLFVVYGSSDDVTAALVEAFRAAGRPLEVHYRDAKRQPTRLAARTKDVFLRVAAAKPKAVARGSQATAGRSRGRGDF
jgi:hypothetical protein